MTRRVRPPRLPGTDKIHDNWAFLKTQPEHGLQGWCFFVLLRSSETFANGEYLPREDMMKEQFYSACSPCCNWGWFSREIHHKWCESHGFWAPQQIISDLGRGPNLLKQLAFLFTRDKPAIGHLPSINSFKEGMNFARKNAQASSREVTFVVLKQIRRRPGNRGCLYAESSHIN